MYKITLYDENCSPIVDGVARFFTEDIDDFEKNWTSMEQFDEASYKRFLASKNGEIVTDYYSDNPDLNIVQQDKTNIIHNKSFELKDITFTSSNAYGFTEKYHVDNMKIDFIWIKFKNEYWRSASFVAEGAAEWNHILYEWGHVSCFGNPVILNNIVYHPEPFLCSKNSNKDRKIPELNDFKDNTLRTYCYTSSILFGSKEELDDDFNNFQITPEILDYLFADVIGEAG